MSFVLTVVIAAVVGGVCGYIAAREEWLTRYAPFRWGMIVLFILMLMFMQSHRHPTGPIDSVVTLLMMVVAALCWTPCLVVCVVETAAHFARGAVSLDDIRIPPSYSIAEGAAARGDLRGAITLYLQTAAEHPEAPEPCRRIAELHIKLREPDLAVKSFREAIQREKNPGNQLVLVFAVAEVLADLKKDVPAAIETIESFVKNHPEVDGRRYADMRLRALRERIAPVT